MKKLVTAKDVAKAAARQEPHIEDLWQTANVVKLHGPLAELRGRHRGHRRVYFMRNGKCCWRAYTSQRDARTPAQLACRAAWSASLKGWSALDDKVRQAWQKYAAKHLLHPEDETVRRDRGMNAYAKTQPFRLALGMGLSREAPSAPPPPPIRSVEQVASDAETSFAFRVFHGHTRTAGMKLLFYLTPAMATLRRTPQKLHLRWICAEPARSFADLGPSGTVYTFTDAQFAVAPGQRYGVAVRTINPDGVPGPGPRVDGDFVRLPFAEPAAAQGARAGRRATKSR